MAIIWRAVFSRAHVGQVTVKNRPGQWVNSEDVIPKCSIITRRQKPVSTRKKGCGSLFLLWLWHKSVYEPIQVINLCNRRIHHHITCQRCESSGAIQFDFRSFDGL